MFHKLNRQNTGEDSDLCCWAIWESVQLCQTILSKPAKWSLVKLRSELFKVPVVVEKIQQWIYWSMTLCTIDLSVTFWFSYGWPNAQCASHLETWTIYRGYEKSLNICYENILLKINVIIIINILKTLCVNCSWEGIIMYWCLNDLAEWFSVNEASSKNKFKLGVLFCQQINLSW